MTSSYRCLSGSVKGYLERLDKFKKYIYIHARERKGAAVMNPMEIEQAFREYARDIERSAPDWVIHIDLELLQKEGIVSSSESFLADNKGVEEKIAERFHVIESPEKVTLFNDQFSVWIVPRLVNGRPETFTMIASNRQGHPHLELVFATTGVFNTPSYILKVLEHYLEEVMETDAFIRRIEQAAG